MAIRTPTIGNREDLEKYYDYVIICSICKKKYGVDIGKEKYANVCPACDSKLKKKKEMQ